MLKKVLMLCFALVLSIGMAFAAVDVNTADQAALESVKGLGPVKSQAIIDERSKNGPFKNADDLADRVKGLGTKSVSNLENAGLTIGGSSAPPSGAAKRTAPPRAGSVTPSSPSVPAPSTTMNTNSGAPAGSTIKTTPAATGATSPAATTETTPPAKVRKRASKTVSASGVAAAGVSAPVASTDSTPATKGRKRASKATSDGASSAIAAATGTSAQTSTGASDTKAKKPRKSKAKAASDAAAK